MKNFEPTIKDFFKRHRSVIEVANKLIIDENQNIDVLELNHKMYEVESLEELKLFVLENYILKDFKSLFFHYSYLLDSLAEEQGKKIQFEISGDKILVDQKEYTSFSNILIHLFRNMIDHGVETIEERKSCSKPEIALIKMEIKSSNNKIIINLEDDGRGIDPHIIKEKALSIGLKSEKELEDWDETSLIDLIFLPGFSTKKSLTDLSGRGVGMDAVRNKIEEMDGKIKIKSELSLNTKYLIEIPLPKISRS